MCGISGVISAGLTEEDRRAAVQKMNSSQAHRGPDNEGLWLKADLCLGHRRLSIIDLSEASNQPLFSPDGRYAIVYNGELYNYRELKLELQRSVQGSEQQPYFFRTASDTEVVLAAFIRWGVGCVKRFNGMFAFAVYDSEKSCLTLARDRLGVKPLYYSYSDKGLVFASEIRAILKSGINSFQLDEQKIAEYAMYQTVHAPSTVVKGIRMLLPGHYAEFAGGKASVTCYYDLNAISSLPELPDYQSACAKVDELLSLSVQRRLVSDVPFGAFLSGGIDSSAIVGLMSKVSTQKVRTFNVAFDESEFSESRYARLIAKKFNTIHEEILLSPQDFLNQLPEALQAMDHPGGDGPNTYVVAKATRNAGITMALSGVGGDELFAGYGVFTRMATLQKRVWLNALPHGLRRLSGMLVQAGKGSIAKSKIAELLVQEKIDIRSAYMLSRTVYTLKELGKLVKSGDPFERMKAIISAVPIKKGSLITSVSKLEIAGYMQNVLLRDADQMGMAVALEIREPFLDYRLVEYVLGLPDQHKFPHTPKKLLVDSLGELLPREIVQRPKMGFTLPWQHWLKHELKSFCEKNINEFSERSFSNREGVKALWKRFLNGDPQVPWSRVWHLVVLNHWIGLNLEKK